jgi:hypothetical protein
MRSLLRSRKRLPIDDADYHRLVIFSAIDEEFNALQNEDIKKQNG